jgi:hypothetical protein
MITPNHFSKPTFSPRIMLAINVAIGNSDAPKIAASPGPVNGTPFINKKVESNGPKKPSSSPNFNSPVQSKALNKKVGGKRMMIKMSAPRFINKARVIGSTSTATFPLNNMNVQ